MDVLLEVYGFDVDRSVEMTMIQAHINVQKRDLGRKGMPSEFDRIAAIKVFKQLDEGVGIMRKEAVIGKT